MATYEHGDYIKVEFPDEASRFKVSQLCRGDCRHGPTQDSHCEIRITSSGIHERWCGASTECNYRVRRVAHSLQKSFLPNLPHI